ncbi:hypothetical protein [Actinocrinis puniceicyclus]|uniref:hypothetical protein n=1 Tax=Actinocrinis puniceicyclus TaxID=977794 RepID=UPI001FE78A19|nr:hypothetical protein [Actinocrinis puniceicyclus]
MSHLMTTIDDLLRDARVLADDYCDYQPPAVELRLARALARRAMRAEYPESTRPAAAAPNRGSEPEQARHELDLTCTLVLNWPQAAASFARLTETLNDPDGALVFACLLHLTAREEGARFWWKFAAGAGNPTAAFCLYLDHRRHAEYRDADYWRRQSSCLRVNPLPRSRVTCAPGTLLPRRELRALLAECHEGRHPQLPPPIERAISRLPVADDECLDGEVPTPSRNLVTTLSGDGRPRGGGAG